MQIWISEYDDGYYVERTRAYGAVAVEVDDETVTRWERIAAEWGTAQDEMGKLHRDHVREQHPYVPSPVPQL